MPDLMTSHGRAVMLRRLEPHWRHVEDEFERHAVPLMRSARDQAMPLVRSARDQAMPLVRSAQKSVESLDRSSLAKIGGGVLAVALIAAAAQFFFRSSAKPAPKPKQANRPAPKAQKRASRPAPTKASGARRPGSARAQ